METVIGDVLSGLSGISTDILTAIAAMVGLALIIYGLSALKELFFSDGVRSESVHDVKEFEDYGDRD
jgi:hypothetical protein